MLYLHWRSEVAAGSDVFSKLTVAVEKSEKHGRLQEAKAVVALSEHLNKFTPPEEHLRGENILITFNLSSCYQNAKLT